MKWTMRALLVIVAAAGILAPSAEAQGCGGGGSRGTFPGATGGGGGCGGPTPCSLDHVARLYRCEECQGVFSPQELVAAEDKATHKVCPKDHAEVRPGLFCERTFYHCEKCGQASKRAEKCKACGGKPEKVVDRTPVQWHCRKCSTDFDELPKGGKCPQCKKDVKQACPKSGIFPHGGDVSQASCQGNSR